MNATMDIVEQLITLQEANLLARIAALLSRGMSVAAVAAALSISPVVVQNAEARQSTASARARMSDEEILARTIEGEAESESIPGKHAVASTIWNRAHGKWHLLKHVATAPKQYSIWNKGVPPRAPSADSLKIARSMLNGTFTPSVNATHYYNPSKLKATPRWAQGAAKRRIGNHIFVTLKESA